MQLLPANFEPGGDSSIGTSQLSGVVIMQKWIPVNLINDQTVIIFCENDHSGKGIKGLGYTKGIIKEPSIDYPK